MLPSNKISLIDYYVVSKIMAGSNLKITFQNKIDIHDTKILTLKGVAGFIDTPWENKDLMVLRIDSTGGSFNTDLSLRLQKPFIQNLPEIFIFTDEACVNFCFRAVAETVEFRDWEKRDNWLPG